MAISVLTLHCNHSNNVILATSELLFEISAPCYKYLHTFASTIQILV